eukprot:34906_1
MDQLLLYGVVREYVDFTQHGAIYALCYRYYQHYPYHITFAYFLSDRYDIHINDIRKQLMGTINYKSSSDGEVFMNHKYFTLRNGAISSSKRIYNLQTLSVSDAAILPLSTEWDEFERDFKMCHQFGIQSFIIICDQYEMHKIQNFLQQNDLDVNSKDIQFLHQVHDKEIRYLSSKISKTFSQIINNNELNKEKQNLANKPFLMSIDYGFNKKSKDHIFKVFTGFIISGSVTIGDNVKFIRYKTKHSKKYQQMGTVKRIEIYRKSVGVLTPSTIGENIGICVEFNLEFDGRDSRALLMTAISKWSPNIFEIEYTNVSREFLEMVLKFSNKNGYAAGYYPRMHCSRTIESGNQRKGCILKRVRLIQNDQVLDSQDIWGGSWGKSMYWIGYDAKLVFEGDIYVTPYTESKYFGSICMFYGCDKSKNHWMGKVVAVGDDVWNQKESAHSVIISKWIRDHLPSILYPIDLKEVIL